MLTSTSARLQDPSSPGISPILSFSALSRSEPLVQDDDGFDTTT